MRIVGGNFGVGGLAFVKGDVLQLDTDKGVYSFYRQDIESVSTRVSSEKKFGCVNFIFFAVLFSVLFGVFLSILGVAIGLVLAIAVAFYKVDSYEVVVKTKGDRDVTISCNKKEAAKIDLLTQ